MGLKMLKIDLKTHQAVKRDSKGPHNGLKMDSKWQAKRVINANIMKSEFSATEMAAAAGAGLQ